jgi:endonuclease YncB( thermonuclease family)
MQRSEFRFLTCDFWIPSMALASRILSILLGIAVMALLLWPINIPLGFGQAWWAKDIAASRKPKGPPAEPPVSSLIAAMPGAQPSAPVAPQAEPTPSATPDQPASLGVTPVAGSVKGEQVAAVRKDKAASEASPPAAKLYYKVRVIDAGTIQSGSTVITLADIIARDAKATCKDAKGRSWRCGEAGRVALMRLIRARAVSCILPQGGEQKAFTVRCSVAGTDLSTWVVREGWANPKDSAEKALADAEDAAKKDKVGLWRGSQ